MRNKKLKNGTLVLFNETLYTINGYKRIDNMYYLGTETENRHFAKCYVIYQKRGAEGVYNYANKYKIPYKHCRYCECDTPQIGKDCLVCQTRND